MTLGLGIILALKYVFFDGEIDIELELQKKERRAKEGKTEQEKEERGNQDGDKVCNQVLKEQFRRRASTMPSSVKRKPRLADLIENEEMTEVEPHVAVTNRSDSNMQQLVFTEDDFFNEDPRSRLDSVTSYKSTTSWTVGDSGSDSDPDIQALQGKVKVVAEATQTNWETEEVTEYTGPPRPLVECVAIMQSDVSTTIYKDSDIKC